MSSGFKWKWRKSGVRAVLHVEAHKMRPRCVPGSVTACGSADIRRERFPEQVRGSVLGISEEAKRIGECDHFSTNTSFVNSGRFISRPGASPLLEVRSEHSLRKRRGFLGISEEESTFLKAFVTDFFFCRGIKKKNNLVIYEKAVLVRAGLEGDKASHS